MKDGVGAVRVGNQWGFITATGEFFIPPRFEDAELFFEGLAAVERNGKWGFIDRNGRFVIPPQFDYSRIVRTITEFSEELAGASKNGEFGYIDKSGAFVIAPTFKKGSRFRDGIADVCDARQCGYIDKKGGLIWPVQEQNFEYTKQAELDPQGNVYVSSDEGKLIKMADTGHCMEVRVASDKQTVG